MIQTCLLFYILGIETGMLLGVGFWIWLDERERKKEEKEKNKRD